MISFRWPPVNPAINNCLQLRLLKLFRPRLKAQTQIGFYWKMKLRFRKGTKDKRQKITGNWYHHFPLFIIFPKGDLWTSLLQVLIMNLFHSMYQMTERGWGCGRREGNKKKKNIIITLAFCNLTTQRKGAREGEGDRPPSLRLILKPQKHTNKR